MGFFRIPSRLHVGRLLNIKNPPQCVVSPNNVNTGSIFLISHPSSSVPSFCCRYLSLSAQYEGRIDTDSNDSSDVGGNIKKAAKKPLNLLFKEAVGLSEKLGRSDSDSECESESGNDEFKRRWRKLETGLRNLIPEKARRFKENEEKKDPIKTKISRDDDLVSNVGLKKPRRLYDMFAENAAATTTGNKRDLVKDNKSNDAAGKKSNKRVEEPIVYKELSSDMAFFANHLYKLGYFKDANFLPRNEFDVTCFENNYARSFLKHAAEKFGKDNQEIAKWLSGSDMKTMALFGCPSLTKKNVFSAKTLRTFFKIQEDTVCSKCVLKSLCKFPNQSVWKGNTKKLDLDVVLRVIMLYALEMTPSELVVPDEVKSSISRLFKEIIRLSETV